MDVSIIICTHNRASSLAETLESLRKVEVPSDWDADLLIINNASTDDTPDVIANFEHPVIKVRSADEPQPGKSKALNRAIRMSVGKVLLFTDDDVRFPRDWIRGMGRPILQGGADAVAGGVQLAPELERSWMGPTHKILLGSSAPVPLSEGQQFIGANMAVSRTIFGEVSGFDPRLGPGGEGLGAAEDALLASQVREAGFCIEGRPEVAVEHHPAYPVYARPSIRPKARNLGRSEAYISYHWEHRRWPFWKLFAGWIYYRTRLAMITAVGFLDGGNTLFEKELEAQRKVSRIRQHIIEWSSNEGEGWLT